jgi:hypothetical protein
VGSAAELRARELLAAVAGPELLDMYDELGLIAVDGGDGYGYLLYPHRPIVAYDSDNGELLSEYCVRFDEPDEGARLPDADDLLAKWLSLRSDERGLIGAANMDPPGRQLDPDMVRRDLARVRGWNGGALAGARP